MFEIVWGDADAGVLDTEAQKADVVGNLWVGGDGDLAGGSELEGITEEVREELTETFAVPEEGWG